MGKYRITVGQSKIIKAENFEEAYGRAYIWAIDEKSVYWSAEEIED